MAAPLNPPESAHSISEIMIPDVKTTVNLFGMHLRSVNREWHYPLHEHPQYEINYVMDGEQLFQVSGASYEQRPGDLMLLRPGVEHGSRSGKDEPFTYFCIHFNIDDQLFLSLLSRIEQVHFPASSLLARRVHPTLLRLIEIARHESEGTIAQRMRLQSAIFELFAHLWEAISDEAVALSADGYEKVELAHQIRNLVQGLVNQSFHHATTSEGHYGIDDIAAKLGISASHCNRVFRHVFGISPRAYLSALVLDEAKLLLANPRLSIQHIASIFGYRDIAHFSRQFKRWSGQSPSEYRKQHMGRALSESRL